MQNRHLAPWLSAAALAATSLALAAPVDDQRLLAAPQDAANWLSYGRDYSNQRFSPLAAIDRANVRQLAPRWIYQTGIPASFQATPLIVDGVMYLALPYNHVVAIDAVVPDPAKQADPVKREGMERALQYMGLNPNTPINEIAIDKVFIGSCTNSRIEDLREAASVLKGRHVAATVKLALAVPGSGLVKRQAEAEGLDKVFLAAGFEWREPGCSMCLAMNADRLEPGERCASTSNRNFEGRQGPGGRTHLVSPAMAAAAAIAGRFADVRDVL